MFLSTALPVKAKISPDNNRQHSAERVAWPLVKKPKPIRPVTLEDLGIKEVETEEKLKEKMVERLTTFFTDFYNTFYPCDIIEKIPGIRKKF